MVIRYNWGHGVGHKYSHHSLGIEGSNVPVNDEMEHVQKESNAQNPAPSAESSALHDRMNKVNSGISLNDDDGCIVSGGETDSDLDDYRSDYSDLDDYEGDSEEETSEGIGSNEDDEDLERAEMYGY